MRRKATMIDGSFSSSQGATENQSTLSERLILGRVEARSEGVFGNYALWAFRLFLSDNARVALEAGVLRDLSDVCTLGLGLTTVDT